MIFEEEDYGRRLLEYNPGVVRIPHGFMRFDPTELEGPLREILHANDEWAFFEEKRVNVGTYPMSKQKLK